MPGSLSLLRLGAPRFTAGGLLSTSPSMVQRQDQRRTIVNKTLLKLPEDYPEPWDYKAKGYNKIHALTDRTAPRFHKNSKLIVVEGNLGSGKSKVAKELADSLGFHHIPAFRMEEVLVDRYGNDLRDYYHMMPKSFRIPTMDMFYKDPKSDLTAAMQYRIYHSRFEQMMNSVAHILNTGQGVVLERSPYSDFVFVNALKTKDYIGMEFFKHYYYLRKRSLPHLHFWPHLVVYVDTPVENCLQNIKKRGKPDETNILDHTFLSVIAESYKDSLREYNRHSKILTYDWSTPGHTDTIVEDIERIDFDFFEWHSGDVFEEWFTVVDELSWAGWRQYVTNKMEALTSSFGGVPNHEVSELYINPRDEGHFLNVVKTQILKSRLGHGYDTAKGDKFGADSTDILQFLPEPWFDYYFRELWITNMLPHEALMDPEGEHYDPDYLHGHH